MGELDSFLLFGPNRVRSSSRALVSQSRLTRRSSRPLKSAAAARLSVSAPSEAWRFLQGESPCGVRINHPLLPSVATATAEVKSRTSQLKRTQGNMQAAGETVLSKA